jgi:hypothetical protein
LQEGNGAGIIHNFALMQKHQIQYIDDATKPLFQAERINNSTTGNYLITINTDALAKEVGPDGGNGVAFIDGLGGIGTSMHTVTAPLVPNPSLFIVEEYSVASYLGNFGVGKVLRTFSLLPGEKTQITVKTYKETETTRSHSENAVDSFTENSAKELETQLQQESGMTTNDTSDTATSAQVAVSASASFLKIQASASAAASKTKNVSAGRSTNVNAMNKALNKHVSNSNTTRSVNVNTTSSERYKETEEESIVRTLENPNKSRTLNFVFRQLLQEYVTVTYLSDVRIAYCDGNASSFRVVDLQEIDRLLDEVIKPDQIPIVKHQILSHYCPVLNKDGDPLNFIQRRQVTIGKGGCELPVIDQFMQADADGNPIYPTETYYVKNNNLQDVVQTQGKYSITVPGVALNVQEFILNTDSVIVEALLGQGEALDCFNMRVQQAETNSAILQNELLTQQMAIVAALPDAQTQADNYQKVFTPCCPASETSTNGAGNTSK